MKQKIMDSDIVKKAMGLIQFLILIIATWATNEIRSATQSINQLNVTIAQLLTEVSIQKESLNKIEDRVHRLEINK